MLHVRIACAALLAFCMGFSPAAATRSCDGKVIDQVWTGVRIRFESVATDRYAFIAYYDAKRQFTVARIDFQSCSVEHKHLPSAFSGWDSHNSIAIALDSDGRLHVIGNMHVNPLVYFRSREPFSVASIERAKMIGYDEDRVTYPRFINGRRHLSFLYRAGRAGDGKWYLNEWMDGGWRRIDRKPIFGDNHNGAPTSAYPSEFESSPDGFLHVAVVWRGDLDVQSNFRLSYAKTRDFQTWFDLSDHVLGLPLEPNTMDTIDDVGWGKGLLNNAKLSLSEDGTPYVTYTKYTEGRRSGVYVARPLAGVWRSQLLVEAKSTGHIEGRGTIGTVPRFSPVRFLKDSAVVNVRFPGEKPLQVRVDEARSSEDMVTKRSDRMLTRLEFSSVLSVLKNPGVMTSRPNNGPAGIRFGWVAQAFDRKIVQRCSHGEAAPECRPSPSPLIFEQNAQ